MGQLCRFKLGISIPNLKTCLPSDRSHPYRKDRWRLHFYDPSSRAENRYDNDFMLNQVQFMYKRSTELLTSTSINQYGKFKNLYEITPTLERHGVLQDFVATYFGHFLNFDTNTLFSSKVVHNLLTKEIIVDGVGDSELYFGVDGRRLRFSKYEFCLLTGLKFEGRTHFPTYNK